MKPEYTYAVEDLVRYFNNSFVMLDGRIAQIRNVYWGDNAGKEDSKTGKKLWPAGLMIRVKDKGKYLDENKTFNHIDEIMPACGKVPRCFGYLNLKHTCTYLGRHPERTAIKGLQPERLTRSSECGVYTNQEYGALSSHDVIEKLCYEKFPTFLEAFARICEERAMGVAWHRDWAIAWTGNAAHPTLNYRGCLVGMVHSRSPRDVLLNSRASQLQEAFEESKREVSYND